MHWNHSERCELIALSMAQATEVVQANESINYAFTENSTSSNDNMEFNDNAPFDNNLCGSFSELNDGNNTEDDVDSVTNPNENTKQDLEIMMKYLTFKDNKEVFLLHQWLNTKLMQICFTY
jgi:hypothetical protein